MYKVDYYVLALCDGGKSIGNIKQFSDTWYTEQSISVHEVELKRVVDIIHGDDKYVPVITKIERISGHCGR